ncbi:MAG: hypothetical protein ACPW60_03200 [Methylohalobius sp. ZOD2]
MLGSDKNGRITLLTAILWLGMAAASHAGELLTRMCWSTGPSIWVLNVGSFSNETFEVHGYQILPEGTCGSSNRVPLTGTATLSESFVTVGLWGAANEPGMCVGVSFKILLDPETLAGNGAWWNQSGFSGTPSLTPIDCKGAKASQENSNLEIPYLIQPRRTDSAIPYQAK